MAIFLQGMLVGCIATSVLDLWSYVAKTFLKLPGPNWGFVGRWIDHMKNGQFFHRPIAASPEIPGERAIGWVIHYVIGAFYGVCCLGYLYTYQKDASIVSAIILAWIFLAAPWLVMQPGLGMGIFSSKTPKPNLMRMVSVIAPTMFGSGLYLGVKLLGI